MKKFPTAFTILFVLIAVVAVLTWVIHTNTLLRMAGSRSSPSAARSSGVAAAAGIA